MNVKRRKNSKLPSDRMSIACTIGKNVWQALKMRQIVTGESRESIVEEALMRLLANELAGVKAGAKAK